MMLTRRTVLRWSVGIAAGFVAGAESITQGSLSRASDAEEPNQPAQDVSIETWMNEWMSVSKAPGGMLRISRFREPIYFLTAPISWTPNLGQERYEAVHVPKGFVTDFASIPRIFWSTLRPDGEYAYAAVVHDYLYWTQMRSREEADHIFKMAMEDFEVGTVTIGAIYSAVRVGGQLAWKGNAEKKAQGEKRILTRFPQDPRTKWEDWKERPGVFAP
ncbi:MAG: DUF1353 domain-containing protein [Nitrospira sp.]|nr:DUF1353 domain-containing protein [Nitrospira sp.]